MDVSQAKAIVERDLEGLLDTFGLGHWDVRVDLDAIRDEGPNTIGISSPNADYEHAYIRLDAEAIATEDKLLRVLRHELFHVVVSPLRVYREAANQHLRRGSPAYGSDQRTWEHFEEQVICNLERLYKGLTATAKAAPEKSGKPRKAPKRKKG